MLTIKNLKKSFKLFSGSILHAVKDISIEVESGTIFGFLGPNGAGKTTTIKIILSLLKPTSGEVFISGNNIKSGKAKKVLRYASENPYLYKNFTSYEFLYYMGNLIDIPKKSINNEIDKALKRVNLCDSKNEKIQNFSKGMQQRLNIAQTLMGDSKLVVFDEPASGLDPIGRKLVRDILIQLKEEGKTVFFSSHQVSEVELICDKIAILDEGEIIEQGSVKELLQTDSGYEVSIRNISDNLIQKLNKSDEFSLKTSESNIIVSCPKSSLYDLIELVKNSTGEIYSVNPLKISLEELFVSLVKDKGA